MHTPPPMSCYGARLLAACIRTQSKTYLFFALAACASGPDAATASAACLLLALARTFGSASVALATSNAAALLRACRMADRLMNTGGLRVPASMPEVPPALAAVPVTSMQQCSILLVGTSCVTQRSKWQKHDGRPVACKSCGHSQHKDTGRDGINCAAASNDTMFAAHLHLNTVQIEQNAAAQLQAIHAAVLRKLARQPQHHNRAASPTLTVPDAAWPATAPAPVPAAWCVIHFSSHLNTPDWLLHCRGMRLANGSSCICCSTASEVA